jgi:hypothetical protein
LVCRVQIGTVLFPAGKYDDQVDALSAARRMFAIGGEADAGIEDVAFPKRMGVGFDRRLFHRKISFLKILQETEP